MTFSYRPAVQENTSILAAFAGPSGGGKTKSALRFARGLVGPKGKIAFLDSEARRALHYARQFEFDHGELKPPFTPERYQEAIEAGEKHVGFGGALIIDSATHEWSGDGGCQDIHDDSIEKMLGDEQDPRKRTAKAERLSALGWRDAKLRHKRMMSRLLQCRAHLIFCLRAEEKIKFEKVKEEGRDGRVWEKTVIVPIGWQPICEKNFMFEQTVSFMLSDLTNHLPTPIKLQDQHAPFFPLDRPIDEKCGEMLAAWAAGGANAPKTEPIFMPTNGTLSHDLETGEIITPVVPAEQPTATLTEERATQWANRVIGKFDTVTDASEIDRWLANNQAKLAQVHAASQEAAMAVVSAAEGRKKQLDGGAA